MDILLTLDYELFLGAKTGSVDNCLINTLSLMEAAAQPAKFTIFVDATFLLRLNQLKPRHEILAREYDKIAEHLQGLKQRGHDLQLHIHPHWMSSTFDGHVWTLDHSKYKISDWDPQQMSEIFTESKSLLDDILGEPTIAFRAGGFSAQPTELTHQLLTDNGIKIDSSVTPRIKYNSPQQQYDYSLVPETISHYRFTDDIQTPDERGDITEVPISVERVSPLFYWKYALSKLHTPECHKNLGDGISVKASGESIRQRLTSYSYNIVTIDGMKIKLLETQRRKIKRQGREMMTVIGHPKLATKYSVGALREFVERALGDGDRFIVISNI